MAGTRAADVRVDDEMDVEIRMYMIVEQM